MEARKPAKPSQPAGWDLTAGQLWESGQRREAIELTVRQINRLAPAVPLDMSMQLSYYLFLVGDYRSAVNVLDNTHKHYPKNQEVLVNLAACLSRAGMAAAAVDKARQVLAEDSENILAYDILANNYHALGRIAEAAATGTKILELKDRHAGRPPENWQPPPPRPRDFSPGAGRRNIIVFSLWGSQPRYLRGALRNLLLAPDLYPGWICRFYLDDSVPAEFVDLIRLLGGQACLQPAGQSLRQKLCWRFLAANDPGVGFFLIRDADSVINPRESRAVQAWLESDAWFHVMRDWWTHTDLVLAGMWGGVSGILPDMQKMLAAYHSGRAETPNIDQWFLRDRIWSCLRDITLVHDRCFTPAGAKPFPGNIPGGNYHVGQDESAARPAWQAAFLQPWIERYSCLK